MMQSRFSLSLAALMCVVSLLLTASPAGASSAISLADARLVGSVDSDSGEARTRGRDQYLIVTARLDGGWLTANDIGVQINDKDHLRPIGIRFASSKTFLLDAFIATPALTQGEPVELVFLLPASLTLDRLVFRQHGKPAVALALKRTGLKQTGATPPSGIPVASQSQIK
jgi:hypothetical protein